MLLLAQHFVSMDPVFQEKLLVFMESYTTPNPNGPTSCLTASLSTEVYSCFFVEVWIFRSTCWYICLVSADNGSGVYLLPSEELPGPASSDSAHRGLERELRHTCGHQREVPLHGEARPNYHMSAFHGQLTKLHCSIKWMIMIIASNRSMS